MKTIFTSLCVCICTQFITQNVFSQCNYAPGSTGPALALPAPIAINGNMTDWAPYLANPNNNSYDNTNAIDLDAPIADAGRDLDRFVFTEDGNNLYLYFQRAGSSNNSVDLVYYADINNDGLMQSKEPVFHINWSGANGNVSISVHNYVPSPLGNIFNSLTANLDGLPLMGTLQYRSTAPGATGNGSADGKSVEIKIPFSQITQLNASNNVINQLAFGNDFKYHVSTINGNVSSIPNQNSINDNFGGCLRAPTVVLPIKLINFDAKYNKPDVVLNWSTAQEKNFSHFVLEQSTDGNNFGEIAMVFGAGESDSKKDYNYTDRNLTGRKGLMYYRLKSVDIDNKVSYSSVRIIRLDEEKQGIILTTYPNPVVNELKVTIPANWQSKKATYEVINVNGQMSKKVETANSSQTETINVSNMAPGFYLVKVTCEGQTAQQKIVKQ